MADTTLTLLDVREGYVPLKAVELSAGLYALAVSQTTASAETVGVHLEDAAHASGDPGVHLLAVRKDSATALAGTDGDYQSVITDSAGRVWTRQVGADVTNSVQKTESQYAYKVSLTASGQVKGGAGFLHTITLGGNGAAAVVDVYDNPAASGNKIATIRVLSGDCRTFIFDCVCAEGIYCSVASGTADIAVSYR